MPTLLRSLLLLSLLSACQSGLPAAQAPPAASPTPTPLPQVLPTPHDSPGPTVSASPDSQPSAAPGARFALSPDYLDYLASFSIKAQPDYQLETTLRFEIKNLDASAEAGQASTQWRFSAADLRARTTPLVLEVPFLKAGDRYSFDVHYVSDNQGCEVRAAWDEASIYPNTPGEAVSPGALGSGPDHLNLSNLDFSLLPTPLPFHGRVLLPDGQPAREIKVQISGSDGSASGEVLTNSEGYYVTPRYTSYGRTPTISVVALSDQAAFQTYSATVTTASADAYVCAENLGRHDIQLAAR